MADLSITASSVVAGSDATVIRVTAGAAITAGQVVYKDTTDSNKWKLADADSSVSTANVGGIALNGASDGQPLSVLTAGTLTINSAATVGTVYVLSGTAGGIAPEADLASSDYVTVLGVGTLATTLKISLNVSGVQVP